MSLHARIAIGSSRRVVLFERFVTLGGIGVVAATAAARFGYPGPMWIGFAVLALVALLTWRTLRFPDDESLFVFGDGPGVEMHPCDGSPVARFVVAEDSLLWPGLSVLHLVPAAFAGGQTRRVIVFDRDLAEDDARRLRRFLLWASRGAGRPDLSIDRPS